MFLKTFRLFLFFCVTLYSTCAFAQDGLGGISGKIMGNLLPVTGAQVVIMQLDKVVDKTTTDENGLYAFPYLRPGKYDIKATLTGYRTGIIIKIPVSQDHTTKNDFYLAKINNANMPQQPFVEEYEKNHKTYMRNRQRDAEKPHTGKE